MSESSDDANDGGVVQLVTPLRTVNEQVGAHLLAALQQPMAAGVLTTVMPGIGPEQLVSIPLNPQQFFAVQNLLRQILEPADLEEPVRRVIGFDRAEE